MITKIYVFSWGEKKEGVFKRLKLDMWVDDNPKDIVSAVKLGIKTIMISNEKTVYNHNLRKDVDWVEKIENIRF